MTKPFKVYLDEAIARLEQKEALRLAQQAQAEERSPLSLLDAQQIWELARHALSGQPVEKIYQVRVSPQGTILISWADNKDTIILTEYTY